MKRATAFCSITTVAVLAFLGAGMPARSAEVHSFVGINKCKMCHINEWKSWSQTKMANAFELLKPGVNADAKKKAGLDPAKDYTKDATCLPCHVTGYGQPGGFVDAASTPTLAGVGCEVCHGAGGSYVVDALMSLKNKEYKKADVVAAGLVATVSEPQCLGCHNNKSPFVGKDYKFDFATRKEQGTHQKFPLKFQH